MQDTDTVSSSGGSLPLGVFNGDGCKQKPFSAIVLSSSCKSTAGGDGDSVPGLGKNKNSEQSGVTGESTWRFRRVGDEELLREFKLSLISSFLKVTLEKKKKKLPWCFPFSSSEKKMDVSYQLVMEKERERGPERFSWQLLGFYGERLNSECYCNRPIITLAKSMDNMSCIRRGVSVVAVPHGTSSRSSRRVCGFVVVSHGTCSRSSSRGCGGVRASMVDSYESSSGFVKRMEQAWLISEMDEMFDAIISIYGKQTGFAYQNVCDAYSNRCRSRVLLAIRTGKLNAIGAGVQDSSFSAITYSVKFLPEIPIVLFVLGKGQCAALIVKELVFEQGGWGSLPFRSSSTVIQLSGR
ncbi:hypothetical protein DKX38_027725 [Salix brachista]|uniref:Uncharacterized protein n=1 Tax=Salix brachista TaxID=2182728 RepID=A0A5N5J3S4_9ROSI|nr:hypothetical protein DKX38_027725 [Salix brachista]